MKDQLYTHAIINYVLASYQGRFTYLNVLNQTQHPRFKADDITRTKNSIAKISEWLAKLWQGQAIFSPSVSDPGTIDCKMALKFLEDLKPDLKTLIAELKRILLYPNLETKPDDVKFLIAAFARFAYARDNYLRGFTEFARVFNLPAMLNQYNPLLFGTEEDIRVSNAFFEAFLGAVKLDQGFYAFLRFRCTTLPGVFNTYIHDICQLLGPFRGGFSYDNGDFTQDEIRLWINFSFEPVLAGYWKAYDFSPEEAISWLQINLPDPAMAFEWKLCNFGPEQAIEWMNNNFPPPLARGWADVGYNAEQATEMINKGINDPRAAPKINL